MRIETQNQVVTIEDPPNVENLTQIVVNLQESTVELTYRGHPPLQYVAPVSSDAATWTEESE